MSAPDLASQDTRDFVEKAATTLVMKYVGYPSLSAHEDMCKIIRATLAASAELRSVETSLVKAKNYAVTLRAYYAPSSMVGHQADLIIEDAGAALSALRAITGRKA